MLDATIRAKYEVVVGLEVHAQMLTQSKAYSNDVNEYGAQANSNVSVVSLGHPGTLPFMNKKTVEYAIKLGLACGSKIADHQYFARKNYFYPDLPKGYQITQDKTPICTGGAVYIKKEDGTEKAIHITRIHMEEDAGKSIHDVDMYDSLVDLNRAGVPLLEIVSEPDIRSSQEAYDYLMEVRKLVRYLDICDGNMEEGSMRCDANVSVRLVGAEEFGTKVEVKNMNSMRNVQRAIEFEIERQIIALEAGEALTQETRGFDAVKGTTTSMRSKEAANDYRYFPEPDLQPLYIDEKQIALVRAEMPELPRDLFKKYTEKYGLSEYDAKVLTDNKSTALFYNALIEKTKNYKAAANLIMGDVKSYLNQNGLEMEDFPVKPEMLAELINLVDTGKVSSSVSSQKIFPVLLENPAEQPLEIAQRLNLIQESDASSLLGYITKVIELNPAEVARYKAGEKQLIGFLMGQLMKVSQGKADPKQSNQLFRSELEK